MRPIIVIAIFYKNDRYLEYKAKLTEGYNYLVCSLCKICMYLHFTFHEDNIQRVCEHPRQAEAMRRIVRQFQGQTSVAHRKQKTLRKIRRQFHHLLSTKRLNV